MTNTNVDCEHCKTPTDRCSDESDRNCYLPTFTSERPMTDGIVIHLGHYEVMRLAMAARDDEPVGRVARLLAQAGTFTLIFTPEES